MKVEEVLKVVEVEYKLKNVKDYADYFYKTQAGIIEDLKFYMEKHRLNHLEGIVKHTEYPGNLKNFECTLSILQGIIEYSKKFGYEELRKIALNYKSKVLELRNEFLRKISKQKCEFR